MSNMTIADKREFLRLNVQEVVISDDTEDGYIRAMFELYHIAQDERFPSFIRNAILSVFMYIEEGNQDAMDKLSAISAQAHQARAELNLDVDINSGYAEAS